MKKSKRVGLLANQASVDHKYINTADRLAAMGYQLVALFAPQQGFFGQVQANMIEVGHGRDPKRGVPLYSLYSEVRRPTQAMLKGIDLMIVDLQDVGARGYTFIWTLLYMMEECAANGIEMLILDRPNPLGGLIIEGPLLKPEFYSFVGLHPIPMRYALTIGELAELMRLEKNISLKLKIKPVQKWRRSQLFEETGRPWIMTTANVPTPTTTLLFPGMELLEGTNISEGRGTTRPFEFFGAPFIDAEFICNELNRAKLAGVHFRPASFQPTFDKWKAQLCHGAQIHITSAKQVRSVEVVIAILKEIIKLYPAQFRFNDPPYEYEEKHKPFDILAGSSLLRNQIINQLSLKEIVASWQGDHREFKKRCKPILLY